MRALLLILGIILIVVAISMFNHALLSNNCGEMALSAIAFYLGLLSIGTSAKKK